MASSMQGALSATNARSVISCAGASAVLQSAQAKAAEIGVPVVVAVVDDAGDLVAFSRGDGTPRGAAQWAIDKAATASSFRAPTHVLAQGMDGAPLAAVASFIAQPHVTLVPAGIPLVVEGSLVGAIGASGGSPEQDLEIAEAGAAAL
jgi:glc operon protein GlcG